MSNSNLHFFGRLMIISGPSGSGKSTLTKKILEIDDNISRSISFTTRNPRPGERDGYEYNFISENEFASLLNDGHLLEHTKIHGNHYGTSKFLVEEILSTGKDVLFDIDSNGARNIQNNMPDQSFSIFILPPSIQELEARLIARAQDSAEVIARRVHNAKDEITKANDYDYVVMNENLDKAFKEVMDILKEERLKHSSDNHLKVRSE